MQPRLDLKEDVYFVGAKEIVDPGTEWNLRYELSRLRDQAPFGSRLTATLGRLDGHTWCTLKVIYGGGVFRTSSSALDGRAAFEGSRARMLRKLRSWKEAQWMGKRHAS